MFCKRSLLVLVVSSFFLGGCSTNPNEAFQEKLIMLEVQRLNIEQSRIAHAAEKRNKEVDALPSWVLDPPKTDATGVYGVGISESNNIAYGLKSARLQAEFELAKIFKQEISGSERAYDQGDSDGNVATQTTFLIDKLVDSVPVVGYQVVEQEIVVINGKHNVYVLLKMPFDQFNKIIKMEKEKELDSKVKATFDDLERRLANRRLQKELQAEADFHRKQIMKSNPEIKVDNR